MKISVVTISFNQAEFLQACIDSVAAQEGPFEHIIVDPGSTDGSREIIAANREHFSQIILEKDDGPADGLNRGFARAGGDIYYYLNSDDTVLPGAFAEVRDIFKKHPEIDVVSGGGYVIDEQGDFCRRLWSDPVSRMGLAHGGSIQIQPSTFIRQVAFNLTNGFNIENRTSWDAELIIDLFKKGARFRQFEKFWSGYRLHSESITASCKLDQAMKTDSERFYRRLLGRNPRLFASVVGQYYRVKRILRHPEIIYYRMLFGPVYGSKK